MILFQLVVSLTVIGHVACLPDNTGVPNRLAGPSSSEQTRIEIYEMKRMAYPCLFDEVGTDIQTRDGRRVNNIAECVCQIESSHFGQDQPTWEHWSSDATLDVDT